MGASRGALRERGGEIETLEGVLALVGESADSGAVVTIEGPAGIGKTALLESVIEGARRRRMRVLRAAGGELEQNDGFGLVQQLFGPPLQPDSLDSLALPAAAVLEGVDGAAPPPGEDAARVVSHALFGLCVKLAQASPLLLAVDDAHWADERSLRWLVFLARRVQRVPIVLVIAHRPSEPGVDRSTLDRLVALDGATCITLGPLSEAASHEIVREAFGEAASGSFCAACYRATEGNPFLLGELVAELHASGVQPNDQSADLALSVGPESVARSTLLRLARAPSGALPLARALAVLEEADLRDAAALAGVSESAAASAAGALASAGLLAPGPRLKFAHPLVRSAVYTDIDEHERALHHRQAASVLRASGAPADRVAAHLLLAALGADPQAVVSLRAAARRAYANGAPDGAVRYLRRALDERPEGRTRSETLLELGRAEVRAGVSSAVTDLEAAVAASGSEPERARALRELGRAHLLGGRMDLAIRAFEEAVAEARDERELSLQLEGELCATMANVADVRDAAKRLERHRDLAGETPAERAVLALLAFAAVQANQPLPVTLDLIARALRDGEFVAEQTAGTVMFANAMLVLVMSGREAQALVCLEAAAADAARLGWSIALAAVPFFQSWAHLRRGELEQAHERGLAALAVSDERSWQVYTPMAAATLCEIELERGNLAAAEDHLARVGLAETIPDGAIFQLALLAHGRMQSALGDHAGAVRELLLCGSRELALGGVTPAAIPWRSRAALAQARDGGHEAALALAGEEVQLARALGCPRALGVALAAMGVVAGADGLASLEEAVSVLSRSDARLELARAQCELGAALRRGNRRRDARAPLREALAAAEACGAGALAARARAELLAAGARPRRAALRGVASLTASELRVAQLAAEGRSNREIAAELIVSVRTVEFHLSGAYGKLGIAARGELAGALATQALEPAGF